MGWNYGHEMHPVKDIEFSMLSSLMLMDEKYTKEELRKRDMDYAWITGENPTRRRVYWVAEGSFALPTKEFRKIGGYDRAFRYHEGQDLARRLRENNVDIIFSPDIIVKHLEIDVRKEGRVSEQTDSTLKHWGMSREVYDTLFKRDINL